VLLEALAALAEILNKVGEFGASRDLAEAALPQVCSLVLASCRPRRLWVFC
jgi:hypothetical protein